MYLPLTWYLHHTSKLVFFKRVVWYLAVYIDNGVYNWFQFFRLLWIFALFINKNLMQLIFLFCWFLIFFYQANQNNWFNDTTFSHKYLICFSPNLFRTWFTLQNVKSTMAKRWSNSGSTLIPWPTDVVWDSTSKGVQMFQQIGGFLEDDILLASEWHQVTTFLFHWC